MIRSAVSLPPSCEDAALVTTASGMIAVSALDARAIARSNPTIFWNRLRTRRTNSGRSQNVSVRRTRSRSGRRVRTRLDPLRSMSRGADPWFDRPMDGLKVEYLEPAIEAEPLPD